MEFASTEGRHKMSGRRSSPLEPSWFDQALAAFQEALELVDRDKDPGLYGMILHELADVHTVTGDLQAAAASYRDAAKYKRLVGDPGDLAPTLVALGTCLIRADEPTEARSTLDQAKELLSKEGSMIERRLRAIRLQELGRAYEELGGRKQPGAYGEALTAYTAAVELVDAETDPGFYGTVLQDIGDVHGTEGRLSEAVAAYEKAVEHLRRAEDASDRLPLALVSLGRVRRRFGTLDQSILADGEEELPPGSAPERSDSRPSERPE
jgi:tetratricopeptide (TPR) repeat protein